MFRIRFVLVAVALFAGGSVLASDGFLSPQGECRLRVGSDHLVRWTDTPAQRGEVEEMELILSLDGGVTYPLRVTRELEESAREFRWRVPNVPTGHAHLALRTGSGEDGEVIVLVSAEFSILAEPTAPLDDLRPFRGEFWVGEAAADAPPAEFPAGFAAREDVISTVDSELLADESPSPMLAVPRLAAPDGVESAPVPSPPHASKAPLRPNPHKRE